MRFLSLLRHAKSSWADNDLDDHQRPLNARGLRDGPLMAKRLLQQNCRPDRIYCSSAARTLATAELLISGLALSNDSLMVIDALYLASPATLKKLIEETDPDVLHLMVIGHNPGLAMFGQQLHPDTPGVMPTSAISHYALSQDHYSLNDRATIDLVFHDFPKNSSDSDKPIH